MRRFFAKQYGATRRVLAIGLLAVAMLLGLAAGATQAKASPPPPATTQTIIADSVVSSGAIPMPALPTNCYTWEGNNVGAWPTAYASCSSGTGQFRVVGKFKSWLSGEIYTRYGAWKSAKQTSSVGALGLLDWCTSATVQKR